MLEGSSLVRWLPLLALISIVFEWPAAADPLTGRELQQTIVGHTWAWKSETLPGSGLITYLRDGRMFLTIDNWNNGHAQGGRWKIDGNELCTTLIGSNESCYKDIIRIDAKTFFIESTKTIFTFVK
jgi:hypothetical protein